MSKASTEEGINGSVKVQPLADFSYGVYDTPTCAICGCTENVPCFGEFPCYWVTMNSETNAGLCSECLGF